ncbi:50S ribosomal protein L10 [Pleionea sediminis]|uniref:50S ribosomal protein L10 n=1 Tax=Pleionea sediminis TaxID=2569479 RepID=UPI001185328C|nr:50S ribosomal protein L10 [Pleionea sediminis]
MALGLEGKKAIVAEVNEVASKALSAVTAEYRGMTVEQMTSLRVKARESNVYLKVIRNTLAKRAIEGTEFACMSDALVGPVICAFSIDEPGAAARLINDFSKEAEALKATSVAIGGELHGAEQLEAVSKLPTKEEAIASLMMVMNGPVTKLARTLNEFPSRITRVIAAVKDQKQAA